ncbi:MAG: porin [Deltaproteobacteria bacterium]|nr:porin [Deltaproteobacteria bacterium]
MKLFFLIFSIWAFLSGAGHADDKLSVNFGGYVDTYYAYDFNNSQILDRSFTTQPARHNEFNVNLAYLDAKVSAERIRGRFALQAGTSVQSNYAAESNLNKHIQEATAGYQVTDRLWIDAGIFLAHIGLESWISKENWTYTRSLIADYSPYYETGVKATYRWADQFSTQILVLNGWQNISENNGSKAIGAQLAYNPTEKISLLYNNFIGNELGARRRFFNDFIAKYALTDVFAIAGSYDLGWQQTADKQSNSVWQGYAIFVRYQVTPSLAEEDFPTTLAP